MDKQKQHGRVWLSEIHQLWHGYVKEHPQHHRFAPLPDVFTTQGRR